MKVELLNNSVLDTDKMSDVQAEILEKQSELLNLCIKYDVPIFIVSMGNIGLQSQHFKSHDDSEEENKKRINKFLNTMNLNVMDYTNNKYKILPSKLENGQLTDEISNDTEDGDWWKK